MTYFAIGDDIYTRVKKSFGNQLLAYREAIGLTQQDLSALIDTQAVYVGMVERGEVSVGLDNMTRFAEFFGVDFFVMANPKILPPTIERLPAAARKAIRALRKLQAEEKDKAAKIKAANREAGIPGRAKQLHALLQAGFFKRPKTAKDAFVKLNPGVDKARLGDFQAEIGKITVTLGQGKFVQLLDKLEPAPGSSNVRFVVKEAAAHKQPAP